jgi:hypothetical protein
MKLKKIGSILAVVSVVLMGSMGFARSEAPPVPAGGTEQVVRDQASHPAAPYVEAAEMLALAATAVNVAETLASATPVVKAGETTAAAVPVVKAAETPARAAPVASRAWTVGPELYYADYRESSGIEQDGMMYGIASSFTYRKGLMARGEVRLAYGELDYDGSTWGGRRLSIDNIPNLVFEFRGTVGYDFAVSRNVTLTPYLGFAFRYLDDNAQEKYYGGYERESSYIYSPVGLEAAARFGRGWSLVAVAEYDLFWVGRQESHLSYYDRRLNDIENEQDSGYGLRGSVSIRKTAGRVTFALEPFIRYWDIDKSDLDTLTWKGTPIGQAYEPANETTEVGLMFNVVF